MRISRCKNIFVILISFSLLALLLPRAEATSATLGSADNEEGMALQLQGPIHEAFADVNVNKVQPLMVTSFIVPEPINELPPIERPEGDQIEWIPGYWIWDEGQEDFVWVSGIWRQPPPERTWNPGYWMQTDAGSQYIPGYWAEIDRHEPEYLPPPPEPQEVGPFSPALSSNHEWMNGYWIWNHSHYTWKTGYWYDRRPNFVWVPDHFVWTPYGFIYVSGYWDYHLAQRGVLYAPVYRNPGEYYTPSIVLDFDTVFLSLFVRSGRHHYYFGNYHHAHLMKQGFYPWYSKHATKYGHDIQYRTHRSHRLHHDRDWEKKYHRKFQQRRNKMAWVKPVHRQGKHKTFKHSGGSILEPRGKRFVYSPQKHGRVFGSHSDKTYRKGKIRSDKEKIYNRAAKHGDFDRATTKKRKVWKNVVTKKQVQQKRKVFPGKDLRKHPASRQFVGNFEYKAKAAQFKHSKPERKRRAVSSEGKSKKSMVAHKKYKKLKAQDKKYQKDVFAKKHKGNKKSVSYVKSRKNEARGGKKAWNNRDDRTHRSIGKSNSGRKS